MVTEIGNVNFDSQEISSSQGVSGDLKGLDSVDEASFGLADGPPEIVILGVKSSSENDIKSEIHLRVDT